MYTVPAGEAKTVVHEDAEGFFVHIVVETSSMIQRTLKFYLHKEQEDIMQGVINAKRR